MSNLTPQGRIRSRPPWSRCLRLAATVGEEYGDEQWRPAVKTGGGTVKSGVVAALRCRCRGGAAGGFLPMAAPL